ncbi:sensor histidine kinase [Roseateles oligotrophus]|uniref:histidine kinase n=1 Tax=Roseateles oligotrophus TaxID=1769250 RepID=A0ABT2YIB0_9BURK|nr:ATP-binding protein [Roseateles oligotrophus]MCV2369791.1 ATP-binding protein [Roseateles oligotrophus]
MDSRRAFSRWPLLLWVALMCLGAALAGWQHEAPRPLVLALLLMLLGLYGAQGQLRRLLALADAGLAEPLREPPESARAAELTQQRMLRNEALLEHAPVALWHQSAQGRVLPLNNAARRLVAPGGATDSADLLARLAQPREQSAGHSLFSFESERGSERCLLAGRDLVLGQVPERLLALMPIESELEAETLKAWRQLVHVLTHEIMNSLTPISSLSRTARELLAEQGGADSPEQQDLTLAMDTIARRADSLASFVGNYRRVSELPEPKLEPVRLSELFARLEALTSGDWAARGGAAVFAVEPASLTLMADAGQLEQALLNLIKNAAQACAGQAKPRLHVTARLVRGGRLSIEVRDNGPGVPAGLENDIFLPFFSTKPLAKPGAAEGGQGIGLAVVRNLVHGMGGSVRHVKPVSGGAAFVLSF